MNIQAETEQSQQQSPPGCHHCTKKAFDRIAAIEAMYSARYGKRRKRRECRYYWCSDCRAYHLTSMPLVLCGGKGDGRS